MKPIPIDPTVTYVALEHTVAYIPLDYIDLADQTGPEST